MQQAAQGHTRPQGCQALDHLGHVQRELDRIEEGPVDLALVRIADLPDQVDHAAQGGVVLERRHQIHADDGGGQCGHHLAEGLYRLRHILGNGQQEVQHGRLQVHADVLDREVRQGHHLVTEVPVPIEHEVTLQLG